MRYYRKSGWWSAAALVLDGLCLPLIAVMWVWLGDSLFPGGRIGTGLMVFVCIGVFLGPFLSSFLLTILIPAAPNWSLSLGYALTCALLTAASLAAAALVASEGAMLLGVVLLPASVVMGVSGHAGVVTARCFGPLRCRDPKHTSPGEPRCPDCGYVLYHAKNQTCPECGRRFLLSELDLRRVRWDGEVLKPREPARPADPEPRNSGRI